MSNSLLDRRALLRAGALGAGGFGLHGLFPAWAHSGSMGLSVSGAPVLSGESWTPPSLAGTRLYVRNGTTAAALELGPARPK